MSEITGKSPLLEIVAEFKAGKLYTPEKVTNGWQARWSIWGEKAGLNIVIPDFPDSQKGLEEALKRGDKPIYIPEELASQDQRHLLRRIWPDMITQAVGEGNVNNIFNEIAHSGWRYTESAIASPYRNTSEKQLRELFQTMDREGLNATEYIIASQDSKLLTGEYFDIVGWSRLLGSGIKDWGAPVGKFHNDALHIGSDFMPESSSSIVGGRSSVAVTKS